MRTSFTRLSLLIIVSVLMLACDAGPRSNQPPPQPSGVATTPPTGIAEVPLAIRNSRDAGEWVRAGRDYANTRFSPLDQITTGNIAQLRVAWTFSSGFTRGHEGAPLVVGDTMYVVTPYPNVLYALDLTQPGAPPRWSFRPETRPAAQGVACCDVVNRGAAYGDGLIVYYQIWPHDEHDYDGINENILLDLPVDGQRRRVLVRAERNGFVYVMDRATGEILSTQPFAFVNSSDGVDLVTGQIRIEPAKKTTPGRVVRNICPAAAGAKDWQPSAFSPRTGLVYIPHNNLCMDWESTAVNYIAGTPFVGANVKMYAGPGGHRGEFTAWDPVGARKVWSVPERVAAMLAAVTRGRQRQTTSDPRAPGRVGVIVAGATIVTLVLLVILFTTSTVTGRRVVAPVPSAPPVLTISVTAQQWWWAIEYASPVAHERVRTANEIHVPTGIPVQLRLRSEDVIHSFWVPNLSGKKDVIPGRETTTWIQGDREGVYRGQCSEFCGYQHAHMAFLVVVESAERFAAWLENQKRPAADPATTQARRGRDVFLAGPCVMCHTIRGTQAGGRTGPDLTHVAGRHTLAGATLPNSAEHLARWITQS